MPKVLRIINRFNIGGPTYNATFLTKFISEEYETLLVGGLPEKDESDSLHILDEYGVKPILIPEMKRIPNFKSDREAYQKIKQIIQEFQPDIVHTHAAKAGALGRKAAKACGVPVIVHTFHGHVFHSYFGKARTWIYKVIERRLAKISTGIVAISPIQKEELSATHQICTPSKIKVIPLGFDLTKFHENRDSNRMKTREKWNLNQEEVAVAIIGRLAPIKNHSLFLDVIETLAEKGVKARYFIVGDGQEKRRIEERAKELENKYDIHVELTSWITDIAVFNAGMDIICLSSDNEGTPVSLIEAQASGVPVISTDVGGVKDILLEGETGFVVPKKEVKPFSEKLQLLIENKEIRMKMSQNGWNYVRDKFHYTTLVKNMENYYAELIEKTRKNEK
ncbi:glycosyltransferase [Fluviicola taffensis]|uniref:Glycosyl transferase group 1 n=1 Tax=Fluviicola taffensis (strain DSM 16823 / NCIMB 13979 / RW262) TaxID=755732 RepID=F2I984_FLUTR|nr:glycosyltransferase [Fluviicola taffensis]AEA44041.1 glycosyl transferase group 1 [Fluviicola taffensis DSM 16823]